ncbi:MAG: carbonic anhydrase [Oligoflexia bacterium]|nr:carbonic anhydrase [Oligoflexia bacterium]
MKKLVNGIVEFRKKVLPGYKEMFARLALGHAPDSLFIACSDSRVVPNLFASTDPGDLFVIRNVGNLIPSCGADGHSIADESEAAGIEHAVLNLNVSDIIVCGHSECGAMRALIDGRDNVKAPHLRAWLRHGEESLTKLNQNTTQLSPVNQLSQLNVLQQMEHLKSYPIIKERLASKKLSLHGWWFELSTADVYSYEDALNKFILIDEAGAERILSRLT